MSLTSPTRRWVEVLVLVLFLAVFGVLSFMNLQTERRLMHQKSLFFELQILRNAINLYKVVNKVQPPSLMVLATEVYRVPGEETTHAYMQSSPVDRDGSVQDPFGRKYQYDPATGWIRSTTEGYEFW